MIFLYIVSYEQCFGVFQINIANYLRVDEMAGQYAEVRWWEKYNLVVVVKIMML